MPKGADKLCIFATLIENFPALIEISPKILNLKLKSSVCFCIYIETSWRIWSMNSKETFSRNAADIIDLQS